MTSPVFDRIKRMLFGALYLGIAGWAVWRTTTLDLVDQSPLLPALMYCLFGLTAAGAAVGMLLPEEDTTAHEDLRPLRVPVDDDPDYAADGTYAYADPTFAPARLRGPSLSRISSEWRDSNYSSRA